MQAPVKIGTDLDRHIVSYLECIRDGWLPPVDVTEEEYKFYKIYEPITRECYATKAAVGYGCSFGGKFFDGFARDRRAKLTFAQRVYQASIEQAPRLKDTTFKTQSYMEGLPEGVNVIYCDPPYRNTTNCGAKKPFDSDAFWNWCWAVALRGITVLVTEFSAPPFAMEIWSREKFTDLRRNDGNKVMTERLFLVVA